MDSSAICDGTLTAAVCYSELFFTPSSVLHPMSTSSSSSARKQACQACRQRKKKCDGKLPSCSSCAKWESQCVYIRHSPTPKVVHTAGATSINPNSVDARAGLMHAEENVPPTSFSLAGNVSPAMADEQTSLWARDLGMNAAFHPPQMLQPSALTDELSSSHIGAASSPLNIDSPQWPVAMDMVSPSPGQTSAIAFSRPASVGKHGASLPNSISHIDPAFLVSSNPFQPLNVPDTPSTGSWSGSNDVVSPSSDQMMELVNIFFTRFHVFLPCLHQANFIESINKGHISMETCALPWAVLAVAAMSHPDITLQVHCSTWLNKAMELFDVSVSSQACPTQTLQAAVWIVFLEFVKADMTNMWVFLGKACRLAVLLGWNQVDSGRKNVSPFASPPSNLIEEEERRQAVWALYLMDRAVSCLCGWPLAIEDKQFLVNFPLEERSFQGRRILTLEQAKSEPFSLNASALLTPSSEDLTTRAPMRLIYKASVLLGRIMSHHNNLHPPPDRQRHADDFANLENLLTRFGIVAAQPSNDILQVPPQDLGRVVWLNILLQTCTILLYHPTAAAPPATSALGQNFASETPSFLRCLNAMRNTMTVIKETVNISLTALLNPFLVPNYFLCCRFLAIRWLERREAAVRNDIDIILMLFDRVAEVWGPLAAKYRTSILHDLGKSAEEAKQMRIGTGNYLGPECAT
ncbi:MAG: hypothetical protein M1833_000269 [Piccolia ochrophora]|nr:MAG: hypothetical protein M1833_000269 [Piccolia ochrophora]